MSTSLRVTLSLMSLLLLAACEDETVLSPFSTTLEVGALLSLSGDYGASGAVSLAAVHRAVEDADADLAGEDTELVVSLGDTRSLPLGASVLLDSYLLQGLRVMVGPSTSAEVAAVKDAIDASDALIISPSSTSLDLAIPGDHIFRLAPTDAHLAEELVDLMWSRGQRYLALVYRDDEWGHSLSSELGSRFTQRGGTVISSNSYGALRTDILAELMTDVEADIAAHTEIQDPSQVAFHLTSLDEGSLIMQVAMENAPGLGLVPWYGTDGFVQDAYVLTLPELAAFARDVGYTAPIVQVDPPSSMSGVVERIQEEAGTAPGAYALLTYDAVRIAARTLLRAGGRDASYDDLEAALLAVLADYEGLSGHITLDDNGDRANGTYAFFTVVSDGTDFRWERVSAGG